MRDNGLPLPNLIPQAHKIVAYNIYILGFPEEKGNENGAKNT